MLKEIMLSEEINDEAVENNIYNSKIILYEGPNTLKDATEEDLISAPENEKDVLLKRSTNTHVSVNGQDCYVYETIVNNTHKWINEYYPKLERTPITYFDFNGIVEITVKVDNMDINEVTIRPLKYHIKPIIDKENNTVTFRINKPDAYTVEFNNSIKRALHIFANEIEKNIPNPNDENVVYIGPGEWNIDEIVLQNNQTLYISGGAVVHGTVNAINVNNIKVMGRGILDGSLYEGWKGVAQRVPFKFNDCNNFRIEGVIQLNANCWVVEVFHCENGIIDDLKIVSARPNGDGVSVQSSKDITVQNSFIRSWDDGVVVKNYSTNSKNIRFSNLQIWTDLAQSMEVGFETNKGNEKDAIIENVVFEDITVLHNFHKPIISIHNSDNATVQKISYKNIVVEDANMGHGDGVPYLIELQILQCGVWSTTAEKGHIKNISIDGVEVISGNEMLPSQINGFDKEHIVEGVNIKNLTIKGQEVKSFDIPEYMFTIDKLTTKNITIE